MPSRDEYCPVAKAAEALGDRWSLLLVREMLRGVTRFNELQRSVPGISRSVLAQRLQRLERTGVLTRHAEPTSRVTQYRLTEAGRGLGSIVQALNDWGVRWVIPEQRPERMDSDGLMLWIRRHVVLDALPPRRVVIGFELRESRTKRYWLVLQDREVSLCPDHPGFQEDVWLAADVSTLYRVFLGTVRLADAVDDGMVQVDGPMSLTREFPRWFRLT